MLSQKHEKRLGSIRSSMFGHRFNKARNCLFGQKNDRTGFVRRTYPIGSWSLFELTLLIRRTYPVGS
jgi:hypothetical protein